MNKKERQIILKKFGGRCAYCGCEITKGWHISPILPVNLAVSSDGSVIKENDTMDNLFPSCAGCNLSKMHLGKKGKTEMLTLENYRKAIYRSFEFLKMHPDYKRAVRHGLVKETNIAVEFYFETFK